MPSPDFLVMTACALCARLAGRHSLPLLRPLIGSFFLSFFSSSFYTVKEVFQLSIDLLTNKNKEKIFCKWEI